MVFILHKYSHVTGTSAESQPLEAFNGIVQLRLKKKRGTERKRGKTSQTRKIGEQEKEDKSRIG